MKKTLFALVLSMSLPALHAQARHPMTFDDLQAIHRIAEPQVSPSGKWVLFSVTDVDLAANKKATHLWTVAVDGKIAEKQVSHGVASESGGRFSPDGKQILFVANGQIQLAPWNEEDGTIGASHPLTAISTEADGAIWSPDAKSIAFVSDLYPECEQSGYSAACNQQKEDEAAANPVKAQIFDHLLYRHWDHYQGAKRSHILLVSASDGTQIRDLTPTGDIGDHVAPTFSLGGAAGYAFSPDSKELAYVVNLEKDPSSSTNNDLYTLQLGESHPKPVKISVSPGSDDSPLYSPDGKYLAFRSQARNGYESDQFRLFVYDRTTKALRNLLPSFDGWVDEFAWAPSSAKIFFASANRGEEDVKVVVLNSGLWKTLAHDAEYGELTPLSDNMLLATAMHVDSPANLVSMTFSDKEMAQGKGAAEVATPHVTALTTMNRSFEEHTDRSSLESFWFSAVDGTKVQGFLVRPPHFDPAKKYPVKFLIHGGPQGAWGDGWSYRWNPELFAADGYVVVMVNPRGSTGYGQTFVEGVSGDWGGKPYTDLMTGLDYAEKKYPFLDKQRECALGASYGGFMANWVLTHTDRFKCIVTHDGMFDPISAYGATEEMWFNEWEFRRRTTDAKGVYDFGTEPAQPWRYQNLPASEDPFRKWSPLLHIANAKTPTLIIHGQKDYRLDVSQGFALFTALQRRGVPSEMLYFPDEGHWVLKPKNSQLWYQTVDDWCDRWTHSGKYAKQ